MATTIPGVFSATEAANELQIHKSLICRYCREGRLKAERIGLMWFIRKVDLDRFNAKERKPRGNPTFGKRRS